MNCIVKDLVGENCITLEDGQRVYDIIHPELKAGKAVMLDFMGATVFASPFFNTAVGLLLRDLSASDLNRLLTFQNLAPTGINVLRHVIENSREYYSDPKHQAAVDATLQKQAQDKKCD